MNHNHMAANLTSPDRQPSDPRCGMMDMVFHTKNCQEVLFSGVSTTNDAQIGIACLVVFLVAFLLEGLRTLRTYLSPNLAVTVVSEPSLNHKNGPLAASRKRLLLLHGVQTLLHAIHVFVSYCLMLVVMTYNVWLVLSVILGAAVGYFIFSWRQSMNPLNSEIENFGCQH